MIISKNFLKNTIGLSGKMWVTIYAIIQLIMIISVIAFVVVIDPFFHYHAPNQALFYPLDNPRSQNDGIVKYFDYSGIIAGTSMINNFFTSEADALFHENFIKVPFEGGSYKEVSRNLAVALKNNNNNIHRVIWCLDMGRFFDDKDNMRFEEWQYPLYLYNDNPLDDTKYVFNKDILGRCYSIYNDWKKGIPGGVTSFDEYWNNGRLSVGSFGSSSVLNGRDAYEDPVTTYTITNELEDQIKDNINTNIIELVNQYPNVMFDIYFSPYSAAWWGNMYQDGVLDKQIEAEKLIINLLLDAPNVSVYSFNTNYDMITDLNNYKDIIHYGEWINTDILNWISEGNGRLSYDNYEDYLRNEYEFYSNFDYNSLFNQNDEKDRPAKLGEN